MIGAIVGDIVGSRFEFDFRNCKSKNFELFHKDCSFTDDTVLTIAVGMALVSCKGDFSMLSEKAEEFIRAMALKYEHAGFGGMFTDWMYREIEGPYNSFGNGAAMRVSPVAYFANSIDEVEQLSYAVTSITHNHPEGIKGAEAVAVATYLALHDKSKEEIKDYICKNYYLIDFTLDEIRPTYKMYETCQMSVPQALEAFFESTSFEDSIRNAISIGGDSDTIGAITGSIAGAYYGVPNHIRDYALKYLNDELRAIVLDFEKRFENKISEDFVDYADMQDDFHEQLEMMGDDAKQEFWETIDEAYKSR